MIGVLALIAMGCVVFVLVNHIRSKQDLVDKVDEIKTSVEAEVVVTPATPTDSK